MSGRCVDAQVGQLALLDAVVFFMIAIAVSSTMFYYADGRVATQDSVIPEGQSDPDAVLRVFLHASVGEEMTLGLDGGTRIAASSETAECIQVMLEALVLGVDVDLFDPLNQRLLSILNTTCSALHTPYLLATWLRGDANELLLALPQAPPRARTSYASSERLPGPKGHDFLLTLVLVPTALLEVLDISAGDFDLRPRVCQSSADFQPRNDKHYD